MRRSGPPYPRGVLPASRRRKSGADSASWTTRPRGRPLESTGSRGRPSSRTRRRRPSSCTSRPWTPALSVSLQPVEPQGGRELARAGGAAATSAAPGSRRPAWARRGTMPAGWPPTGRCRQKLRAVQVTRKRMRRGGGGRPRSRGGAAPWTSPPGWPSASNSSTSGPSAAQGRHGKRRAAATWAAWPTPRRTDPGTTGCRSGCRGSQRSLLGRGSRPLRRR
mmetsp:Transcript_10607/g.25126  ORF Transcript_10607/g.25126 Transcript_10607/m.25126 type:complete len:221 (+) Transcript_10607:967-1629(+)